MPVQRVLGLGVLAFPELFSGGDDESVEIFVLAVSVEYVHKQSGVVLVPVFVAHDVRAVFQLEGKPGPFVLAVGDIRPLVVHPALAFDLDRLAADPDRAFGVQVGERIVITFTSASDDESFALFEQDGFFCREDQIHHFGLEMERFRTGLDDLVVDVSLHYQRVDVVDEEKWLAEAVAGDQRDVLHFLVVLLSADVGDHRMGEVYVRKEVGGVSLERDLAQEGEVNPFQVGLEKAVHVAV